ncbi:MAG: hypothetical protein QOF77_2059 [Solirubrobacteraceae bacterium]|nr:hypothetical protein [Solirubrobacteraceae bacterium]
MQTTRRVEPNQPQQSPGSERGPAARGPGGRDRRTSERRRIPHLRDETASRRDQAAQERDAFAVRADRDADIADRRVLELEDGDASAQKRIPRAELRARGLAGRERAARDRARARTDRRLAGADREFGEWERGESRARGHLAALVDSSEDAIIAKTLGGVIETWNRGAQELFGYTAAEAVGRSIAMLVPPERAEELEQIMAKIGRGERVEPLETVRVAKDGRRIDVSLRSSLVYSAENELIGTSSISRNITGQKLLEAELRRSGRCFELSRDLTLACGFDGTVKRVNPAVEQILGWGVAEFLARPFMEMIHPEDRAATQGQINRLAAGESSLGFVNRYLTKGGGYRWLDWNAMVPVDEALIYASARDITDRMRMETALREAEERFRTAFDCAPIGVCLVALDPGRAGRLLQVNPALADMLGRSVAELTGAAASTLTHPEDVAGLYGKLAELTDGRAGHVEFEKRFLHRDGRAVWALVSAAPVSDAHGERTLAVAHLMDISDRKRSEGQLQHLADHDALTGLYNRRRFTEELDRTLAEAKRFGEAGAVLFLDLDGFKFVNDTLGHAAGDDLIARVARLLDGAVRKTDILARMGGDEFAVILARCDEAAAERVAEKLLATLRGSGLPGEDPRCQVSSSIGIALFRGEEMLTPDELVVEADIAMYDAKDAGKDRHAVYDRTEGRRNLLSIREGWNGRLRRAIRDDSFVLHAQPIIAMDADAPPGFELLLRLPDDDGGLIAPSTFLVSAERFGLMVQIDRWVLGRAVRHLHDSHARGRDLMLSVNVSGTTMGDPRFGADVADLLRAHPIAPGRLVVEITETAAIKNIECARALAGKLRSLGCKLAIDDFGAGFSSFAYLKLLHFDYLKIDGEYIRNLCATPTDQLLVRAMVGIARGLGTSTIAEFVGDDATLELLERLGVDFTQGYHLGSPRPLDQSLPYLLEG